MREGCPARSYNVGVQALLARCSNKQAGQQMLAAPFKGLAELSPGLRPPKDYWVRGRPCCAAQQLRSQVAQLCICDQKSHVVSVFATMYLLQLLQGSAVVTSEHEF